MGSRSDYFPFWARPSHELAPARAAAVVAIAMEVSMLLCSAIAVKANMATKVIKVRRHCSNLRIKTSLYHYYNTGIIPK